MVIDELDSETDNESSPARSGRIGVPPVLWLAIAVVGSMVAARYVGRALDGSPADGADVGELVDTSWMLPPDVPLPELNDATANWALDSIDLDE